MSCVKGIGQDIINDCAHPPIAGLERVIFIGPRAGISATKSATNKNLFSLITFATLYKVTGYNKSTNAGFDLVVSDTEPNRYTQFLSMVFWGVDADTVKALNDLNDIVVVVENVNKGVNGNGNGTFEVYGYDTGLFKTSFTKRSNDNGGTFVMELGSREGQAPTRSHYVLHNIDYATTYGALESQV